LVGQAHSEKKKRNNNNNNNNNKNNNYNNNKKRCKNNKFPNLFENLIRRRNGAKAISLQTLFGRLNYDNNHKLCSHLRIFYFLPPALAISVEFGYHNYLAFQSFDFELAW
jgi:hypothetical protein